MGFHDPNFGQAPKSAERNAPRLPLSLPGKFIAAQGNFTCIITNVSRTGALVAMSTSLKVGAHGYLRAGLVDRFVTVTRKDKGVNAVEFDIPYDDLFIADLRRYQEGLEEHLQAEMAETVRGWTQGENTGRW